MLKVMLLIDFASKRCHRVLPKNSDKDIYILCSIKMCHCGEKSAQVLILIVFFNVGFFSRNTDMKKNVSEFF